MVPEPTCSTSEPVNNTPQPVQQQEAKADHIIIPGDIADYIDPDLQVQGIVDPTRTSSTQQHERQPAAASESSTSPLNAKAASFKSRRGRGGNSQSDSLQNLL